MLLVVLSNDNAAGSGNAKLNLKRLNTASNGNAFGSIFYTNMSGTDVASVKTHRESAADDAYLGFATKKTEHPISEKLRITSDGKIGVNNSAPLYALHFKNAMASPPSFMAWRQLELTLLVVEEVFSLIHLHQTMHLITVYILLKFLEKKFFR